MQKIIKKVLTSLKEHSTVRYAKIATAGGFCDIELIIIKATAPVDLPIPERYIQELLKIFSISPSSFHSFILSFCTRFGKTRCWLVAVKCLLLLHRLLRLLPEITPFRSGLIWFRENGLLQLYPCRFRDEYSSSAPESYSAFVKGYARFLDEALDYLIDNIPNETSDQVNRMVQIQSLIDRVIEIIPTDSISRSFVIRSVMKYVILDSFLAYTTFRREIVLVLENLFLMRYENCISAFEIYKKSALQAIKLSEFYEWCKVMGFCIGLYAYPFVDKIPQIQIQALENFLNGMWQLTESSSSSATASYVEESGRSSITEENRFTENFMVESEPPLIQFEVEGNGSWEDILDASIGLPRIFPPIDLLDNFSFVHGNDDDSRKDEWKMQVYNPNGFNHFYQEPYIIW